MQNALRFSFAILFFFLLNPVSAQMPELKPDPSAPVMRFDSLEHHFGTLVQGETVTYEFKFKNAGKTPLIIESAYTNTGATVLDYPKEPIAPGKTGVIRFTFNTTGKMGEQDKTGTINSNNRDGQIVLHMKGKVIPKPFDLNAPVMKFDSLEYDFGTVVQGTEIRHVFHFTNTGKTDLIILTVMCSDGGGYPNYPKGPFRPGESGSIELVQNTKGRLGLMDKTTTVRSNGREEILVLHLKGKVILPVDPNAPVMTFDSLEYHFGTVKQGENVNYEFRFKNTGKSPLIIQTVYTNTGAAVADWPKEPIAPGKTGVIKYMLNTSGKMGQQSKSLVVNSNASEPAIVLRVTGKVEPPPAETIPQKEQPKTNAPGSNN